MLFRSVELKSTGFAFQHQQNILLIIFKTVEMATLKHGSANTQLSRWFPSRSLRCATRQNVNEARFLDESLALLTPGLSGNIRYTMKLLKIASSLHFNTLSF